MAKGALILMLIAGMSVTHPVIRRRVKESGTSAVHAVGARLGHVSLRTLQTAEADFRSSDRDNNVIQDFWTTDVAGLYGFEVAPRGWFARLKRFLEWD